jgi:hypothetical protein
MYGAMEENTMVKYFYKYFLNLGSYKNDKKHGFGKYKWPDGRQYIGFWENGKQHGYAKYILNNGFAQYGKWASGKRVNWLTNKDIEEMKSNPLYSDLFSNNN